MTNTVHTRADETRWHVMKIKRNVKMWMSWSLEKWVFLPEALLLLSAPPAFLFGSPPLTRLHTSRFVIASKRREVSGGACHSHKLSSKWWQISRLAASQSSPDLLPDGDGWTQEELTFTWWQPNDPQDVQLRKGPDLTSTETGLDRFEGFVFSFFWGESLTCGVLQTPEDSAATKV